MYLNTIYALAMEPKFKCFLAAWLQGHWLVDHKLSYI